MKMNDKKEQSENLWTYQLCQLLVNLSHGLSEQFKFGRLRRKRKDRVLIRKERKVIILNIATETHLWSVNFVR